MSTQGLLYNKLYKLYIIYNRLYNIIIQSFIKLLKYILLFKYYNIISPGTFTKKLLVFKVPIIFFFLLFYWSIVDLQCCNSFHVYNRVSYPYICGGLVAKSCLTLATPWAIACQAPLSMGFSRQEYWSGLPFPSPGDLPGPGTELQSPALQADS